jgi:hypothetical protein
MQMREQGVSSAFVVGEKMMVYRVLTLDAAIKIKSGESTF